MRQEQAHAAEAVRPEYPSLIPQRRDQLPPCCLGFRHARLCRDVLKSVQIAPDHFQPNCPTRTELLLRSKNAEENNFEETNDQLANFLRILVESSQVRTRKKEGAVAPRLVRARCMPRTHQREISAQVQSPEVAAPPIELSDCMNSFGPKLWPLDRFVYAVDGTQHSFLAGARHAATPWIRSVQP